MEWADLGGGLDGAAHDSLRWRSSRNAAQFLTEALRLFPGGEVIALSR